MVVANFEIIEAVRWWVKKLACKTNVRSENHKDALTMNRKILLITALAMAPLTSQAGYGVYVDVNNQVTPSAEDGTYPKVTAHNSGGSNCWFDEGLSDWNQFSNPGSSVSIYTERKNSGSCFFDIGSRWFALFAKASSSSPWVQVSQNIQISVNGNTSAIISPDAIGLCGLKITTTRKPSGNQGHVGYDVEGSLKPNCSGPAPAVAAVAPQAMTAQSVNSIVPDQTFNISMKLGSSKTIVLSGLDPESVWELNQCTGNAVSAGGVIPKHTQRKVLPSTLTVTAIQPGQEICDITGWHYPERSKVIDTRYIFTVK